MSSAASCSRSSLRPQIATCTPSSESALAVAKPSPDDAPATAAHFRLMPKFMGEIYAGSPRGRAESNQRGSIMELATIGPDVYACTTEGRRLGESNAGLIRRGGNLL